MEGKSLGLLFSIEGTKEKKKHRIDGLFDQYFMELFMKLVMQAWNMEL
jgi:hypothetical protein